VAGNARPRYHRAVKLPRRGAVRAACRDLGPLRPIAVHVAVVPTVGAVVALAAVSRWWSAPWQPTPAVVAAFAAAAAVATALVLLPPGACGFVAGYALGLAPGVGAGLVGVAGGAVLARVLVWPRLRPELFAFMRARPRVAAVRRLCGGRWPAWGVARLRLGAALPFAVQNLLCTAAAVPVHSVLLGTLLGGLPSLLLAAGIGAMWRRCRVDGELPPAAAWAWSTAALGLVLVGAAVGRRAWRAAGG
jgi:uncharacterized membrane protein YdjX (TVP38/TMEM64 family)